MFPSGKLGCWEKWDYISKYRIPRENETEEEEDPEDNSYNIYY
jgi:hypothetical protein